MSRRVIIVLAVLLIGAMLAGAAAVGGYFWWKERRSEQYFARAERAFSEGLWRQAKDNYAWYLTRHQDDLDTLGKYAQASLKVLEDRQRSLRDAGTAMFQVALRGPDDPQARLDVLEFLRKHRFWADLQYAVDQFDREYGPSPELEPYRAQALAGLGRTGEAEEVYRRIVEEGSPTPEDYLGYAEVLQDRGLGQRADATMDGVLERFPEDAGAHRVRAEYFLETNRLDQAQSDVDRALALAPDDPAVVVVAARAALARSDADRGFELASRAVSADPAKPEALVLLAEAYRLQRKVDEAVHLLSGVDPYLQADNPQLLLVLAELQMAGKDIEGARTTVEAYRKSYPEDRLGIEYFRAREMIVEGKADEAVALLTNVVQSNPTFTEAQFHLVLAQLEAGNTEESRSALQSYMRSNPQDQRAQLLWERAFAGPQAYSVAAQEAQRLLAMPNPPVDELTRQARALVVSAEREGTLDVAGPLATELLESAMRADPDNPEPYRSMAAFQLDRGDVEGAQRTLQKAREAGVQESDLALVAGAVLLRSGDVAGAIAAARAASQTEGSTRQDAVRWADLFARNGSLESAQELLRGLADSASDPADRVAYMVEEVSVCRRSGALLPALERAEQLSAEFQNDAPALAQLDQEVVALCQALLASGRPEMVEQARALVGTLAGRGSAGSGVRVVQAELALAGAEPDIVTAEGLAQEVLASDATNAGALIVMYDVARRQGQDAKARGYAERALNSSPGDYRAQLAAGEARLASGAVTSAVEVLEPLADAYPNDLRALELLTRAYALDGRGPQAQRVLDQIRADVPDGEVKQRVLDVLSGWVTLLQGDTAGALAILEAQYAAQPDDPTVVQTYARALGAAGRGPEAQQVLQRYADAHESSADAWSMLGQFHLGRGAQEGLAAALQAYRRALALSEEHMPALRGMIDVQYRLQNTGAALSLAERYLAIQPDDAPMQHLRALILSGLPGRADDALAGVTRAIEVAPRPEYYSLRGLIRLDRGEHADALRDLQQYTESLSTTTAQADAALAEAYLGTGDATLARQYFESAQRKAQGGETVDPDRMKRVEDALNQGA